MTERARSPRRALLTRLALAAVAAVATVGILLTGGSVDHEVWSTDQGTDRIHIYNAEHQPVAVIDVSPAALRAVAPGFDPASGRTVPHMIDFDSEHRYAFSAATAGGATIVLDDRC